MVQLSGENVFLPSPATAFQMTSTGLAIPHRQRVSKKVAGACESEKDLSEFNALQKEAAFKTQTPPENTNLPSAPKQRNYRRKGQSYIHRLVSITALSGKLKLYLVNPGAFQCP